MIDKTLVFILGELNGFLGTVFPDSEPHAVLSSLTSADGSPMPGTENRVILSLANIERETAVISSPPRPGAGGPLNVSPPLNLNVYLLLASNFGVNYAGALTFLSASLGFLQSRPVFTPQNAPAFPRGLERLTIEMVTLSIQDLQNVWATTGAKYLPSALYKLRMVTMQDGWVTGRIPTISGTDTKV